MTTRERTRRSPWQKVGLAGLIVLAFLPILGFFYYMIATSLKSAIDIMSPDFRWLFRPTLDNYRTALAENDFGPYFINSFIIAFGSTSLALIMGLPAAYAIARRRRFGWASTILASRLTPGIAFLIPWFILFRTIGWLDTYQALVASHLIISLPLVIWLMVGFFEDLPDELLEAAKVDGASESMAFIRIAVPLVRGGAAAAGILAFMYSWNNFLFSIVLAGRNTATLPVAVFNFMSYGSLDWGAIAAGAVIMSARVVLLVLLAQRHIVEGLTIGSNR